MDDIAFVALGSNVGDRQQHLTDALRGIAEIPGVIVIVQSAVEETLALGPVSQGPYLNQMVALRTQLSPPDLLTALHRVEQSGGRVRSAHWGPRTIDLDIVKYARTTWNSSDLQVPHKEIDNREFWRRELAELEEVII